MARVVVFDFDGTLVDSNAIKRLTFHEVARAYPRGSEIIEDVLAKNPDGTRHEVFAAVAGRLRPGDGEAADRLAKELIARYTTLTGARAADCPEIPGAAAVMAELAARGCLLAINSSTPTDALVGIIERRGWRERFRSIHGAPTSKEENLRRIAADLRIGHKDMVMVGDREADRRAASKVGCAFVALVRPDSDFAGPVPHSLHDLGGLPALLASPSVLEVVT
jgi:phosphoglycolate phosphatase